MSVAYEILPDSTRVWIYQSTRVLDTSEVEEIKTTIKRFAEQWISHNQDLRAFADVYYNQFIVLMVDESQAGASGCSIDKSVHFIKRLEMEYSLNLFDRMTFSYKDGEAIKMANRETFSTLYKSGKINDETLVFDNLVKTKGEFESQWLKPLNESWHKRMV